MLVGTVMRYGMVWAGFRNWTLQRLAVYEIEVRKRKKGFGVK